MSTEADLIRVEQPESSTGALLTKNCDQTTQTIDVSNLFDSQFGSDGDCDLGKIPFTALGKLLDALPIPTLLVDSHCRLIFSNGSVKQLGPNRNRLEGALFTDLLALGNDAEKSKVLINKTEWILNKAFTTRQPQQAETILSVLGCKRWCRLHFRTVRVLSNVCMLILVEDITSERIEHHIKRKEEIQLKNRNAELERQIQDLKVQLSQSNNKFRREMIKHKKTQQQVCDSGFWKQIIS